LSANLIKRTSKSKQSTKKWPTYNKLQIGTICLGKRE